MLSKKIIINSKTVLNLMSILIFVANTFLYLSREYYGFAWTGDYQVYSGVDSSIHTFAYLYFLFYFFSLYLIIRFLFSFFKTINYNKEPLRVYFFLLVFLFLFSIYGTIFYGVGKASSTGEINNPLMYLLIIFSFDAFYYVYAVRESRKKNLIIVSSLYIISNILKGWAGFVVFVFFVYILRKRSFRFSSILIMLSSFITIIPFLLVVRSVFRNGDVFSLDEIYFIYNNISELISFSLERIVVRLDFYSNYIGFVSLSNAPFYLNDSCMPLQENILFKVFERTGFYDGCTSIGSILPGFLYQFFVGKGTAFAVGSGFFGLDVYDALVYYVSIMFLGVLIAFIVFSLTKDESIISMFVFIYFLIFFQGWVYQFTYQMLGFIFGCLLLRGRIYGFKREKSCFNK